MPAVISSRNDDASRNINGFISGSGFDSFSCSDLLNYSGKVSDFNIFVSKHESAKKVKSLTCHCPGNFGPAKFGGEIGVLSCSNALMQSLCLRLLNHLNDEKGFGFECAFEVTHHGPSINSQCLFVEIGSSKLEWNNLDYCKGAAGVVLELLKEHGRIKSEGSVCAVGIGGPHYAPEFSKMVLRDDSLIIGHICPDYAIGFLDKAMLIQMIEKTNPKPSVVLINKSINSVKRMEIVKWCSELGVNYKRLR